MRIINIPEKNSKHVRHKFTEQQKLFNSLTTAVFIIFYCEPFIDVLLQFHWSTLRFPEIKNKISIVV